MFVKKNFLKKKHFKSFKILRFHMYFTVFIEQVSLRVVISKYKNESNDIDNTLVNNVLKTEIELLSFSCAYIFNINGFSQITKTRS